MKEVVLAKNAKTVIKKSKKKGTMFKMKNNNFKNFLASKSGIIVMSLIIYIVILPLFVWLMGLATEMKGAEYTSLVIALVCAFFGWKALNKIQPNIFLIMPIVGWIIFFLVKGILSVIIGIFVTPYIISKKISEKISASIN